MKTTKRGWAPALLVALLSAMVISACGYGSSGGGGGVTTVTGSAGEVQMKNRAFSPADISVAPGTTITWKNNDSTAHTVTASGGAFDSGRLESGQEFGFTFSEPGTYEYACTIHPSMKAEVTVK